MAIEVFEILCQPLISGSTYRNMGPEGIFLYSVSFHVHFIFISPFIWGSSHLPQLGHKLLESLHGDFTHSIVCKNIHGINSKSISLSLVVPMCP